MFERISASDWESKPHSCGRPSRVGLARPAHRTRPALTSPHTPCRTCHCHPSSLCVVARGAIACDGSEHIQVRGGARERKNHRGPREACTCTQRMSMSKRQYTISRSKLSRKIDLGTRKTDSTSRCNYKSGRILTRRIKF